MENPRTTSPLADAMDAALRREAIDLDRAALDALLDGVDAAPPPRDPAAWLSLVTPSPSPALAALLQDYRHHRRPAARPAGVAPGDRLPALRAYLATEGLDGFLVPRADEHQGEFVAARAERLAWLTGFTGSAGMAAVLANRAALFVDGRYTLQSRRQIDLSAIEPVTLGEMPPETWLARHAPAGGRIGYDPWLHTAAQIERFERALAPKRVVLVPVDRNAVDAVWPDQPPPPLAPAVAHGAAYAGQSSEDKRAAIAADLARGDADAVVLTLPDSIAWLFNLRGGDVPHTPLTLGFAVLSRDGTAQFFVDGRKITYGLRQALGNGIALQPPDAFLPALARLRGRRVRVDPHSAARAVFAALAAAGADIVRADDPCQAAKAAKNAVELEGARQAHIRDGVALTRFLAWLDRAAPAGGLSEMTVADRLKAFRFESDLLRDLSFDTIAGSGLNGAIVHYRATPETDRPLDRDTFLLVDSGGQYPDGTTDVTRTVVVGDASPDMKDRFTRVLKGHIALATARFPAGTPGSALDALARRALWDAGLDYDHGTGHGVGSYLGVHEGPQRISKMASTVALRPGMIVSNEPGYYKEGAYGIRIENLVVVVPAVVDGGEREMFSFETLTLAPIDRRAIDRALLTDAERCWIDAYHRRVGETLTPLVDLDTARWLAAATAPL